MTKQKSFGPTQRIQKEYAAGMRQIIGRILAPRLPDQTLESWLAELAERSRAADIQEASEVLAQRMYKWANVGNQHTWREAAARSQKSRRLYQLLRVEMSGATGSKVTRLIRENAQLISSLPVEAATMLVGEVTKAQQSGARAGTINKMLRQRFPQLVRSRVQLISRTETAKASTALTQARCEELDIPFYEWLTSEDQRTRASHKHMNGVIVPWSQPPSPEALIGEKSTLGDYHAGAAPNCRCTQAPILDAEDIKFPAKVYWSGSIQRMGKQQFIKLLGG